MLECRISKKEREGRNTRFVPSLSTLPQIIRVAPRTCRPTTNLNVAYGQRQDIITFLKPTNGNVQNA